MLRHLKREHATIAVASMLCLAAGGALIVRGAGLSSVWWLFLAAALGALEYFGRERPPGEDASPQRKGAWLRKWTRIEFEGGVLRYCWGWKAGEATEYRVSDIRQASLRPGRRLVLDLYRKRWWHHLRAPSIPTKFYDQEAVEELMSALKEHMGQR